MSVASRFLDSSTRVILLEAGGESRTEQSQDVYRGSLSGLDYPPFGLEGSRQRFFGGTSNHWNGFSAPFDRFDLQKRDWLPYSGWPISWESINAYHEEAGALLELGEPPHADFSLSSWTGEGFSLLQVDEAAITAKLWKFSTPVRFAEKFGETLRSSRNVRVCLNAAVTDIVLFDSHRSVAELAVSLPYRRFCRVRAKQYVLALGGMETPRLLLNSDRQIPAGVGNESGSVGRFFCEHPHLDIGLLHLNDRHAQSHIYYQRKRFNTPLWGYLQLSEQLRNQAGLLNGVFRLHGNKALSPADAEFMRHLPALQDKARRQSAKQRTASLVLMAEQAPDPDCRITLNGEKDRFGMRRINLHWQLGELDRYSIEKSVELLGRKIGQNGLGRLQVFPELLNNPSAKLRGGNHHMGTTRMGESPRHSVVDGNCRVHGLDNLYVAGSGVFSTAGCNNPTYSIVALSLRLADHLKRRL
jgi:choline dehydrogenase-like flavoprotein